MLALILYFLLSHIASFLCSIFEAVLLSCSNSYIALLKKQKHPASTTLEELKNHVDRPLAAILTVNTIAHTFGAAGVGASVVEVFGDKWLALGSVILTLTMLYWTEMLPKTIGALYWKNLAPICAKPIRFLMGLTYPFVISFNFVAKLLARGKKQDRITEEDIRIALEAGTRAGVIEEAEQDMVENIFRLGDRKVGMLMQPRVDICWLDVSDSIDKIQEKILSSDHHRFLVCDRDIDKVVGIVHARDLLRRALQKEKIDLRKMVRSPIFVNENQHIFEIMDQFKKTSVAIALVTDEYGSIQGMITTGDILDAVVKEVDDESKEKGAQVAKVNNRSWVIEGNLPIDEFKEIFHLDSLPDEEQARYRTLSGLCMYQLGSVPKKGDVFVMGKYRFEIIVVRKRRVEKILLTFEEKI